jgi:hypothetical protein
MLATTAVLAATLLAAACGDDDGDGTASTAPASPAVTHAADEAGLADAARRHAQRLIDGDTDAAYDGLAAACRAAVGRAEYAAQYSMAVGVFSGMMGFQLADASTGNVTAEVDGDGGGTATVELLDPEGAVANAEPEPWVHEDGRWVSASCPTPPGG